MPSKSSTATSSASRASTDARSCSSSTKSLLSNAPANASTSDYPAPVTNSSCAAIPTSFARWADLTLPAVSTSHQFEAACPLNEVGRSNLRRTSETLRPAETELVTVPAELFQIWSLFETVSAIDRRDGSGVARCFLRELYAGGEAEFGVDVREVGLHGAW
jgi:hypothetical protein